MVSPTTNAGRGRRRPFTIAGEKVLPGEPKTIRIPISVLADHTAMRMSIHVMHGRRAGPTMFVSGAIHGDEILGVEIIRRLKEVKTLDRMRGTLILVPIVNAYGFVAQSRYLPDRRDLNRSFPGSAKGSLAGQLAHRFMADIVSRCEFGIDLHTGAIHRSNLPQIRADLDNPEVCAMANAFGASIMLNANLRDGSLRQAAQEVGCNILLYEAGEALRFDENAIRIGVRGVLGVMRHAGMLAPAKAGKTNLEPIRSDQSYWLRAPVGGILRLRKRLGDEVQEGELLAEVSDPLGENVEYVTTKQGGIIIGVMNLPVVNRGDALLHVALVENAGDAEDLVDALEQEVGGDPLFDGFETV